MATPHPGWAEQDAEDWRTALRSCIREAVAAAHVPPASIVAIAVAAQVDGIVAVDRANRPLAPALIWMDRRAVTETERLDDALGAAAIRAITGLNPDPGHGGPKMAWLAARVTPPPDAYLVPAAYLVADLTDERVIDHANASSTLAWDVRRRAWSPELLDALEIEATAFGRLAPAVEVAGPLTSEAAADLGLTTACVVAVGTGDEHAACLAAGALEPGLIADVSGTAEPVAVGTLEPVWDGAGLLETHAHVPEDRWLLENPGFLSGGSVRWLAESILGCSQPEVAEIAATAPPGADGVLFLPALSGAVTPRWDEAARGVFSGLALNHDRGHLARAVLEGCAFAVRDIVERIDELGLGGDTIRVVGGGSRNRLALQIRADVTNRRVEAPREPEATALGAAQIAAVAAGWYPDLPAASALVRDASPAIAEPIAAHRTTYDDAYGRYRATFEATLPTFARTADTGRPTAPLESVR
jgi:xylulokinase